MAYFSQENKKELAPAIKAVLKQYGVKGTISVQHYSKLVVTLKEGPLFEKLPRDRKYMTLSAKLTPDEFEGAEREFLEALGDAMMKGNHDKSDYMSDYHDVGWYADIQIGRWDKAFAFKPA